MHQNRENDRRRRDKDTAVLRVIGPECLSAIENMSIDQALVDAVPDPIAATREDADQKHAPDSPVLRLYTWQNPTLSLGYFQPLALRDSHPSSESLELIRRGSGGGAIVHHHELTYSLTVPRKTSMLADASESLYESVHQCLTEALAEWGATATPFVDSGAPQRPEDAFLCFQRRTAQDLIISGYKIAGSAQRRGRRRLIQHGSILLAASPFAPEIPGIADLTSQTIDPLQLAQSVTHRLASLLGLNRVASELTGRERQNAGLIAENRFGSDAWTHRR